MKGKKLQPVYIYDAVRTPRGRGHAEKGALRSVKPVDLLKAVFDALRMRNRLDTSLVDEVILGCNTVTGEQGANLGKIAPLYAGWQSGANGVTVSSFCTSGLEAVELAALKIASRAAKVAVAGGVESMSRVPMFSDKGPWFSDPDVARATKFIHMGLAAEAVAGLEGLRREDLDRYAMRSHRHAVAAWQQQAYRKDVIPVVSGGKTLLVRDENMRTGLSIEKMAQLPLVFDPERDGKAMAFAASQIDGLEAIECLHSVGTAPALADAASVMLMGNRRFGTQHGLDPSARILGFGSHSVDPVLMLTGVVEATRKALKHSGLKLSDIDLFEINESFAAIPLMYVSRLGLDIDRVNVTGGAIALGHPLGATGPILLGTLMRNLHRNGMKRGLATICGAAGIAQATVIEVV